jgi:hypothetical protein
MRGIIQSEVDTLRTQLYLRSPMLHLLETSSQAGDSLQAVIIPNDAIGRQNRINPWCKRSAASPVVGPPE